MSKPVLRKYGKSIEGIIDIKASLFDHNSELLLHAKKNARLYARNPKRVDCKNCGFSLSGESFYQLDVQYILCENCGHLCGEFQDTDQYCAEIYDDPDATYSSQYTDVDTAQIEQRLEVIYRPKCDFLFETLQEYGESPNLLTYCELGSGAGYFLKTLQEKNVKQYKGYEVSRASISFAEKLIGPGYIHPCSLLQNSELVRSTTSEVLVCLGVLEHLQNPREILSQIKLNPHIKYLYLVVPLFSPAVFLEAAFPSIAPRVLHSGHTHLYTNQSIAYMTKEFGLTPIAEWWFGTDIFDLFRSITTLLSSNLPESSLLTGKWREQFLPLVDDLQLVLDRTHWCSQIHLVASTTNSK